MDKRIFGSILTILILLGVLWVFAEHSSSNSFNLSFIEGNKSAGTGGSRNFTATKDANPVGRSQNITLNFTLYLNFTRSKIYTYNITNITIKQLNSYFNLTKLGGLAVLNYSGTYQPGAAEATTTNIEDYMRCKGYESGLMGIQCLNGSKTGNPSNISGNATITLMVPVSLNWTYGSLNIENATASQWDVYIYTNETGGSKGEGKIGRNNSKFGSIRTLSFGIDDLRPRISYINISDGTYTRTGEDGHFNVSKGAILLNNTDINVTIVVNERNRDDIWMFYGILNSTLASGSSLYGTNWSKAFNNSKRPIKMTNNTGCLAPKHDSTISSCWYSAIINNSGGGFNFSDGVLYTLMFWTNDSFNHEANFTNGLAGYNFTIDGDRPIATMTMPTITNVYSGRSITIKCDTSDNNGVANLGEVVIKAPSGRETSKTVDNNNHEAIFSGINELGEAGLYKIKCKASDTVGHTYETVEQEFRVMTRSVATAGEAPEAPIAKVDISSTETPSGSISGIQGESDTFTVTGATAHRLTFLEIGKDYAKIKIESMPVELTLKVGESKEIELDDQTVKVTLSSIVEGKASVSITNVAKYEEKIEEEKAAREAAVTEEKGYGLWVTLLVIVVLIVIGYLVLKSRKGKKGEIHFTRQDLGL